ncbi:MAG: RNA polymerase sigma factor [Bacteroidaceae bacterium]|nr:RNA polymerase sigma factor [Bacteroidaceae bacterium]
MSRLPNNSERELVDRLRRGDASAMGEVYACFANYLTAVCSRYIIEDEDIRDVLQESFIKIFTKADTFHYEGEGSLKAWVTQVTVNEALQHLRNQKRKGMVGFDDERIEDKAELTDETPPINDIPTEVLMEMIRNLPPGYRTVFNLYVIEGKRHKEIAELLGIQEQTSASQLMRARRLLAMWIKEYNTHKQETR